MKVYALKTREGVQIYRNAGRTGHFCTFVRGCHDRLPDKRWKWITLNCFRWRLVWL